jgi:hypothetical protein
VDDDQIGSPPLPKRFDQATRHSGVAKSANHDGGAVEYAGHCFATGREGLVDHDFIREMPNCGAGKLMKHTN